MSLIWSLQRDRPTEITGHAADIGPTLCPVHDAFVDKPSGCVGDTKTVAHVDALLVYETQVNCTASVVYVLGVLAG